ncbi:MAG TPA: TolC family protein, partial [Gemmatimonadaceae bacterium]|nr:TolC family protein [Gemmatimonadaceae bacterium]
MYPKFCGRTLRRQHCARHVRIARGIGIPFRVATVGVLVALATVSGSANGQAKATMRVTDRGSLVTARLARRATDADSDAATLDSLLALARTRNPAVRAAESRVVEAHATIGPAGARPDPMLMAGVLDFPYGKVGYTDNFTMNMLRVTQTFPYPGKLSLATRAAEEDETGARATLAQQRLDVER